MLWDLSHALAIIVFVVSSIEQSTSTWSKRSTARLCFEGPMRLLPRQPIFQPVGLYKSVTYGEYGEVLKCVFCRIASGEELPANGKGSVLYEDESVISFAPREPASLVHILVCPKKHIRNCRTLDSSHVPLLDHMRRVGQQVAADEFAKTRTRKKGSRSHDSMAGTPFDDRLQFSFHAPPWHSVDHLHLHCFVKPFISPVLWVKYRQDTSWCVSYDAIRSEAESIAAAGEATTAATTTTIGEGSREPAESAGEGAAAGAVSRGGGGEGARRQPSVGREWGR
ncbi:unnamed protein product [Vitrella brassicaformis CCMP3155]|uniref:HIT domain-containing protein n=2 Tax=Vitrella brassicaformis TaxID=1169539 RepID=A0A0G4H898_VITBC|nr:unnamed protein product [Vitrella brassicaformis CCMP3155]|eukprot:CEM40143.1 unnamed protein product [Vitrella brassicaformis CCMP3155]